jgi:predicted ATP-grasp superfamily ATP-dependent carboligase
MHNRCCHNDGWYHERSERVRILFTEGASLSARQTLYPLGSQYEIDVIDPDPLCQCRFSSYVRRFMRSPSFTKQPAAFLKFVARLIRDRHYDVLLPTHEQIYLLSRFREAFHPAVGVALPEFSALKRLQNKAEFSRLLAEIGLPQPETEIICNLADLKRPRHFPFYLKLAHSTGGGGVFFIGSQEQLQCQAAELETSGKITDRSEILVQQPAKGVLSTVQAVFNHGALIGIHMFEARSLGVGGMSTARVSADHPAVHQHVALLGKHLGWHGAFFLDYFYDRETARPEYIEANPRIGETVNAMLSGINLPQLLVRISLGEEPTPAPTGRTGVRTHNLLMIAMSMGYAGTSRLALIREMFECLWHRGIYEDSEDELIRTRDDPMSRRARLGAMAQLLAWPGRARQIVAKTIANYSLPESAIDSIDRLPRNLLAKAF